jgi:4-hydroxybenzoate polyprenyltransferase
MFSKFIERIEEMNISFREGVFGFLGILCIRFFLENFSNPTPSFPAAPDIITLLHYALFYIAVFLSLALVLRIFIPDIGKISKVLLFGFPVIWLSPIIDLIRSRGAGSLMAYIFATASSLPKSFLEMGGSSFFGGVTFGIKTELVIILIGILVYGIAKTKSILKPVLAVLCAYCVIFFWLALPSFIALLFAPFSGGIAFSPQYFLISHFAAGQSVQNFIRPTVQLSYSYATGTVFNIGISYFYYLLDFLLFIGWMLAYRPNIVRAFLKNARPMRIGHYFLMILIGILAAIKLENAPVLAGWIDGIALLVLFLSYFCAWLFAVGVNDIADTAIDRISNKERPLVTEEISKADMQNGNLFFFSWSLIGGYLGGYWTLFVMLIFTAAYYIYSAPPLRFKRIPIVATFLISLACLSATMAGFYFASPDKLVSRFPLSLLLAIVVCFTLGANIKDIKDIEGDRAADIPTIPVIFGEKAGKLIIGGLLVFSFFAVPAIFVSKILFLPAFIAAVLGYIFVVAEPYKEWRIFALYFAFIAIAAAVLMIH